MWGVPVKRLIIKLLDRAPPRVARVVSYVLTMPRQLLTIDLVRYLICSSRYIWFVKLARRLNTLADHTSGVAENTIMHNLGAITDFAVTRSHQIIRPVIAIDKVRQDITRQKV